MTRFLLYFLTFFFAFCGNFLFSNFSTATHAQEIEHTHAVTESPLWKHIKSGEFVPMRFLTLKRPIFSDDIAKNDESILRFVSPDYPLSNISYRPSDLVSLSGANINEAGRVSQIRAIAKPSVLAMAKDFSEHFGEPLIAISAFRSAEYQQRLWDLGRCDDGAFCAKPGRSEHQLGLGVDFFDATSETQYLSNPRYKAFYEWMKDNAYRYGWTQSYKHGPEVDGYEIEPWHWRYIGVDMATELHRLDMSYTRFLHTTRIVSQL